jgi:hypothetical protein
LEAQALIEEARRHQRRRHRQLAGLTVLIVAIAGVVLISSTTTPKGTASKRSVQVATKGAPLVRTRTPLTLDLFWNEPSGWANVSVNLSNGAVHKLPEASSVFGLARQGYILGSTNAVTVSMSYDLGHTLHTWSGKYGNFPVPADNPLDVWVSSANGATEVNQYEHPVAPTVSIPVGTVVVGQAGFNLVLLGSPPAQMLELWSPAQQRVLAVFGAQEYSDADAAVNRNNLVWSDRNAVHIDGADGVPGPVLNGPRGDVATSLDVSPDGSRVAVVFEPAPGTPNPRTDGVVELIDVSDGSSVDVPGSAGASDLLAWSPDGTRIFFPKINRADTSAAMATYRIGGHRAASFVIPDVRLPITFSAASGSVVVVNGR